MSVDTVVGWKPIKFPFQVPVSGDPFREREFSNYLWLNGLVPKNRPR
jgi:hypothetical protein